MEIDLPSQQIGEHAHAFKIIRDAGLLADNPMRPVLSIKPSFRAVDATGFTKYKQFKQAVCTTYVS